MLFTTPDFAVFLVVVLALFYALPKGWRRYLLVAASLYFYMSWKVKYVVLILGLITLDFSAAFWIVRQRGWQRRAALLISLSANIGLLGYFKYTNFLREALAHIFHAGLMKPLDIIVPLGISFHTFQSISYVIDVYRGEQPLITNYIDYALFVSFFPQLVAGPIVRARQFFGDYFNWSPPSDEEWRRACTVILTGFLKKLVCADQFALVADRYYNSPVAYPGLLPAWTGTIAFALQIFFDFSGYTDIAIGVALLFGFHFPENFRRPYLSASVTEFWRRWHITLSMWLRDYVYIPLGGNRRGKIRTYVNLCCTMLVGGLWHGANWTFLIWGAYHGVVLAIERMARGTEPRRGASRVPRVFVTFGIVSISWVFFRAKTVSLAWYVIRQMFSGNLGASLLTHWHWALIFVTTVIALCEEFRGFLSQWPTAPVIVRTAAFVAALVALEILTASDQSIPFVYFQF